MIFIVAIVVLDIGLRYYMYRKTGLRNYLKFTLVSERVKKEVEFSEAKEAGVESQGVYGVGHLRIKPGEYKHDGITVDGFGGGKTLPYEYTINSLSFRDKEFSVKKDKYRICALGGSTTFGVGVNDSQTYPYCLQQLLGKGAEVINCGFAAYRTFHIYELFEQELQELKPDTIIIMSAFNDAFKPPLIAKNNIAWRLHGRIYNRWMFYTLLLEKISAMMYGDPTPFYYRWKNIPPQYSDNISKIISLARQKGIKVVLVKQAANFPLYEDLNYDLTQQRLQQLYASTRDNRKRAVIAYYYYVRKMEDLGRENNLLVVDPIPQIAPFPELFIDCLHLKAKGNKILAEIIAKDIKRDEKKGYSFILSKDRERKQQ